MRSRSAGAMLAILLAVAMHLFARLLFGVDDGRCGLDQFVSQLCGRRTESDLIGNLIEAADRL